jgi:hypothetical protein
MQRIEKRVARANAKLLKDAPRRKQSSYYGNRNLAGLERTSGERSTSAHAIVSQIAGPAVPLSPPSISVSRAKYHPKRRKPKSKKPNDGQPKEKSILVHCRFCQLIIRPPSTAAVRWSRRVTGTAGSESCDCAPMIWGLAPKTWGY